MRIKRPKAGAGPGAGSVKLVGGSLCLDYANTVDWHASERPREMLTDCRQLIEWCRHVGTLTEAAGRQMLRRARRRPAEAAAILWRAIALRDAIYQVFSALTKGRNPHTRDLDVVNGFLSEALGHLRVVPSESGFEWNWVGEGTVLDRMLWPIARSAGELLTSPQAGRVGQCADDRGCGWLFLDTSKNRSRRWCEMADCGNRAKARRHFVRRRAQDARGREGKR